MDTFLPSISDGSGVPWHPAGESIRASAEGSPPTRFTLPPTLAHGLSPRGRGNPHFENISGV